MFIAFQYDADLTDYECIALDSSDVGSIFLFFIHKDFSMDDIFLKWSVLNEKK